jgi:hypothetical protein
MNPKTEIEPQPERSGDSQRQITQISTDFEEVIKPKRKTSLVEYQIREICEIRG